MATSTPRQRSGSGLAEELTVDDGLELSSGFENPHFDRVTGGVGTEEDGVVGGQGKVRVTSCEEGAEDSDDIGPVVDQVIFSTQKISIHTIYNDNFSKPNSCMCNNHFLYLFCKGSIRCFAS